MFAYSYTLKNTCVYDENVFSLRIIGIENFFFINAGKIKLHFLAAKYK